ncbi:hypothetical protein U9M48_011686 [Paspalum notatum var. saurae]|uniref:Uncharacterized protein n=1 Tax=Paspalum notatum var. saurae TaxID=547442 RepID=A0AAQ3SVX8_PASNO
MALRSLAVKLKALPLRVPGFARAGDPWDKVIAEFRHAQRHGSTEELPRRIKSLIEKEFKPHEKKLDRQNRFLGALGLLLCGSLGVAISRPHR